MIAWLCKLARSFGCAFAGLAWMIRTQRNAQIHVIAAAVVIAAGVWLQINRIEWCAVTLACGMVICAEALNSAIEKLADAITTEKDVRIRHAKDAAAAGVLAAAIAALIVGLIVFVPRVMSKL